MSNKDRAERIVAKLDELTSELVDLAATESVKRRLKDIRTEMGFEKGGFVGHTTLDELLEEPGSFSDEDDEEE